MSDQVAQHKQLSRDEVVGAARALLAAGGRGAFSVRQVAERLGVSAATVQWHTGSRDDLMAEVVEQVVSEIPLPYLDTATPEDWLRLTATAIRRSLLTNPNLVPVVRDLLPVTRATADLVVAIALAFERAGYRGDALRTACDAYIGYVFGYTLLQHAQTAAHPSAEAEQRLREHLAGLADAVPSPAIASLLRGTVPAGWESVEDAIAHDYAAGLEALLVGLQHLR